MSMTMTMTSTSTKNQERTLWNRFKLMNNLLRLTLLCMGLLGLLAGCAHTPVKAPYPHESILTVVAELKIYLAQDPYRQEPGKDLNGRNIFRVTLERLARLEEASGAQYADVLSFARAQCLERLGEWAKASGAFEACAARATSLAAPARQCAAAAARMDALTRRNTQSPTLESYLNDLDVAERRLGEWALERPLWPYESAIRQAREQIGEERVWLLFTNRLVQERGAGRAVEAAQRLIEANKESWRTGEHWLLLGSLYEAMARDWTTQHRPDGLVFKTDQGWGGWIEQARAAYRRVAQSDGDPAKLEGQARLRALDAYALRVQGAAR